MEKLKRAVWEETQRLAALRLEFTPKIEDRKKWAEAVYENLIRRYGHFGEKIEPVIRLGFLRTAESCREWPAYADLINGLRKINDVAEPSCELEALAVKVLCDEYERRVAEDKQNAVSQEEFLPTTPREAKRAMNEICDRLGAHLIKSC